MSDDTDSAAPKAPGLDFIRELIAADLAERQERGPRPHALPARAERLPAHRPRQVDLPELRHRRSEFGGLCNLRFDDTNPAKEDIEYVESIKRRRALARLRLGRPRRYYASDYFEQLYDCAVELIQQGQGLRRRARPRRRSASTAARSPSPARDSPYRDRSVEENLDLFARMRAGEFPDGAHVLRAKIDMALAEHEDARPGAVPHPQAPTHHRTGDAWCIYPMYDFAHGLSDAIEGITHSICTLEFENHRPLYDWFLDNARACRAARSRSSSRGSTSTYTVMSKRKLLELVQRRARRAAGTIRACRRSPACAGAATRPRRIRDFCERIGVAKTRQRSIDVGAARALRPRGPQPHARRACMAVLRPLKVVIENYPEGQVEELDAVEQPRGPGRRHAQGAVLARALHRARRLPRGPAEEVLPPGAGRARCACATPTSSRARAS